MLEAFLILSCLIYALEYSALYVGLRRSHRIPRRAPDVPPRITIMVAARNEERNIERCVKMLLEQQYPPELTEIIIVDDESEDATARHLARLAAAHPGRLTVLRTHTEESQARGKARAIAQGMDRASGEIILLTDADCAPPVTWARGVVEHFLPGVDVVGGFTVIEGHDLFSVTQQLDWIHLQTLGSSALALGFPVGVIGNNLAFRRAAYEAVGGYRSVAFSVTEDFALFRAMTGNGHGAIFPCSRDTRMFSLPCESLTQVLRQKQRWSRGGMENTVPGYTIFIVAFLGLMAFTLAPFVSTTAWIIVWAIKFGFDLMMMFPNMRRLGLGRQLRYFLLFEFYFVAQALVTPIFLMNKTVVWKGRAYRS
ncbi:MAG: hypothetical protein JWQ98_3641 [Chlorobi bacterium]|nr:hypothetical protein [Chlorobiota bacterium]